MTGKDRLYAFELWMKNMPRAELGGLLKEYFAESNHNSWDCWGKRDLTGIRNLVEDMMRYHASTEPKNFATKQTTTNPVP